MRTKLLASLWVVFCLLALTPTAAQEPAELATEESQPTFKLRAERNVVVVRVVVRDAKGNAIGTLGKNDFQLFDNGKPQAISSFEVESVSRRTSAAKPAEPAPQVPGAPGEQSTGEQSGLVPRRFLALYFDDVHLGFGDIAPTRDAADRYLAKALQPGDRVGLFTSSGQGVVDFTADLAKIHEGLLQLRPRPVTEEEHSGCPQIGGYQAYLMEYQHDRSAVQIAAQEAFECNCDPTQPPPVVAQCRARMQSVAEGMAAGVLNQAETNSESSLRELQLLVRRAGTLPGQRFIILVSPGFLTFTRDFEVSEIIDRALQANVVISAIDSRGLYTAIPFGDASQKLIVISDPALVGQKSQILRQAIDFAGDVMGTLAASTGGVFFHNSNNLDEGFRRAGELPEVYYVLTFSPRDLKMDGRFHALKVALRLPNLSVQARRGYYAPNQSVDAASRAQDEIQAAIFSQDEMAEIPMTVRTQFFKSAADAARLSVVAHVGLNMVQFRKETGRNVNDLIFTAAVFDLDGKIVGATQKLLHLRLLDSSVEKVQQSGVSVKFNFDVKPGKYLVRQVVRDAEGQMSSTMRNVEVP